MDSPAISLWRGTNVPRKQDIIRNGLITRGRADQAVSAITGLEMPSGVLFDGGRDDYLTKARIADTQRQNELRALSYARDEAHSPVPAVINLELTPSNFHLLEDRVQVPFQGYDITRSWIPITTYDSLRSLYDATHLANIAIDFQGLSDAALSELGPRIGFPRPSGLLRRPSPSEFEYKSFTEWARSLEIRDESTEGRIS